MLADNAELLSLYASAYELTAEEPFASSVRDILRFFFTKLYDPATGAFFGSQDADETYYPLPEEERALRCSDLVLRRGYPNGAKLSLCPHRGVPHGVDRMLHGIIKPLLTSRGNLPKIGRV